MFILLDYISQRDCCKKKMVEKVQICVLTEFFLAFISPKVYGRWKGYSELYTVLRCKYRSCCPL